MRLADAGAARSLLRCVALLRAQTRHTLSTWRSQPAPDITASLQALVYFGDFMRRWCLKTRERVFGHRRKLAVL
jgi:hypothetical protein